MTVEERLSKVNSSAVRKLIRPRSHDTGARCDVSLTLPLGKALHYEE